MKGKKLTSSRRIHPNSVARRRWLAGTAVLVGATQLPARYSRPVVEAVMLPAHAQTSPRVVTPPVALNPSLTLTRVFTDLRTPSGEVVPIDAVSRIRLFGCDLPAGQTISVICTAGLLPSGTVVAFTQAATITNAGNLAVTGVVNATTLIPLDALSTLEFQLTLGDGSEVFVADANAVSDAVVGVVAPTLCS